MQFLRPAWSFGPTNKSLNRNGVLAPCVLLVLGAAVSATAQGHPPGGGGGMGGINIGRAMPGESRAIPVVPRPSETRGGLQLGPPLRWWDDKKLATTVGLDLRQTHRMDDVFTANRDMLTRCYKTLQHEESQLQKLTRNRDPDENAIFQQIDRVTMARGELEKANAHVLLLIRKEMTPDQTAKLDELQATTAQ